MIGGVRGVLVVDLAAQGRAASIARALDLPIVDASVHGVVVAVTADRVELRLLDDEPPGPVFVDFVGGRVGWRRTHGGDDLARAVGKRKGVARVVDATAGLGRDAAALAHAGFDTVAIERSPVVATLLADGLARAGGVPRLHVVCADATTLLDAWAGTERAPDAVYLDPMYPERKGTAKAQKEMVLLRAVVGAERGLDELFTAAMRCAKHRVVVKRPAGAPPRFPGVAHAYEGRSTRFDLYLPRAPTGP